MRNFFRIVTGSCLVFICIILQDKGVFGQVRIDPFRISSSNLFEQLTDYKAKNPDAKDTEILEKANSLLASEGLNFNFVFDSAICKKIRNFKAKNKNKPIRLRAILKPLVGDITVVFLPDVKMDSEECGKCYVKIPLLESTPKSFIAKIRGLNIKFHLPANFFVNRVDLVDTSTKTKLQRAWLVPNKLEPLSISLDSEILYYDVPESGFENFALIFFDTGVFQFYKKSELTIESSLTKSSSDKSRLAFKTFGDGENKKTIAFNKACK